MRSARLSLGLLALCAAFAAHADFKRSYAEGLDASRAGDWATVRQKMQEALAEEPTPVAKLRLYGTRFDAYVPQYYLGLAAYRQGNCQEAVANWENAAARAIIAGNDTLSGVANAGLADCRQKLAATAPAPRPASTAPTAPTPTPTAPIASNTPSTTPSTPAPRPTTPTPAPTTPAPRPVAPAPAPAPAPPPPPPKPVAASTAPEALSRALDAYLAGRYTEVAALDPGQFSDNRARYHALLVRAAARYTQSQLAGAGGSAALAAAQADIRSAKALAPGQQPDAALYSPRFIALYAQTR